MNGYLPTKFGPLVDIYLIEQRMTQKQLADLLGISPPYLSDLIRGNRRPPLDLALRIADVLGIHQDVMCYVLHVLPPDLVGADVTETMVRAGFEALRDRLQVP